MRFTRFAAAVGVLAVTAVLQSGCAASVSPDGAILTVNGFEPQGPLAPAFADDAGGSRILDQLFAGLAYYDASGAAVYDLAESIVPNAANTVYTVSITDGARFSNGEPVTADSFVDAWVWAARAENASSTREYFADIVGYSEEQDVSLEDEGGLVVLDEHSFEIHLSSPLADFPQRLGHLAFSPLPRAFFDDPAGFGDNPIGNGPYMLDGAGAWQHGERIELVANPFYAGQRTPLNDGVTMVFYESLDAAYADLLSGNLDVLDTLPASALSGFEDDMGRRSVNQAVATLDALVIPSGLEHFSDQEGALRRAAISMAIDRDAITADLLGGTSVAAHDFSSPALSSYSDSLIGNEVLEFDPNEAKAKWAQAQAIKPWENVEFEIAYTSDGDDQAWAEAAARSISSVLGINAVAVAYPSLADLLAKIADGSIASAYPVSIEAGYPGVYDFIAPAFGSKSPLNTGGYLSADFDSLIKEGSASTTLPEANASYQRAQEVLLADLPAIPLWNTNVRAGYAEGIEGVALDWRGVPLYYQIAKVAG